MIPSALQSLTIIGQRIEGRRLALFFDYDGTLTPIVKRPELAVMAEDMREAVQELARLCSVAIVSGRDREDVQKLVQVDSIFYAGSHGFDIAGPGGRHMEQREGEAFVPLLREAEARVREKLAGIAGALVESKKYAFAVHYRLVADADYPTLEAAVNAVEPAYPTLRKKGGKKVFEILPRMDWDKGKAVLWLLEALELNDPRVLPCYLGDDLTDEDAFRALRERGLGILVAETPGETQAHFALRDVAEVRTFLQHLAGLLAGGST
jgi:trehalose-phosphatase